MLWTILVILIILWLRFCDEDWRRPLVRLIFLVIALIILVIQLVTGRRVCSHGALARGHTIIPSAPSTAAVSPDIIPRMKRSGIANLPLHGGRVPDWLGQRMTRLGTAITEAIIHDYGTSAFLSRLSNPFSLPGAGRGHGNGLALSGVADLQ